MIEYTIHFCIAECKNMSISLYFTIIWKYRKLSNVVEEVHVKPVNKERENREMNVCAVVKASVSHYSIQIAEQVIINGYRCYKFQTLLRYLLYVHIFYIYF